MRADPMSPSACSVSPSEITMTGPVPLCGSLGCAHFQVLQTVQK